MTQKSSSPANQSCRRDFLKDSAGTVIGVGLAAGCIPKNYAGVSETIRVGLVGCGGRGTGAAKQAMSAGNDIKLVALGDVFSDQVAASKKILEKTSGKNFAVDPEHCFAGFDAYEKVTDCVDVVLLATPPHFRPQHLAYAVEKGKHVFVEKPVAVDGPGIRSVLATCQTAERKGLSIVSGLCWRYHQTMRETVRRVQSGQIGDIIAMQCNYNTQRPRRTIPRQPDWTDMDFQLRNWYFYTWLSGDHNVEQHIHSLDKMAWILGDRYPVRAIGMGGRGAVSSEECGHIYDHHAVSYEFAGGVRCFSYCRQQAGVAKETEDYIFGTDGTAKLIGHQITGKQPWKHRTRRDGRKVDMYQQEHDELFAGIRSGDPINNGEYMCYSTLMAIMGRMATYTGQEITWDQALNSQEDLSPPRYEFGPLSEATVAVPGITKAI